MVHAYVEPGALYRYVPVYFSDYVRSPPPYKSGAHLFPALYKSDAPARARGAADVCAPGQVTERLRSLGVVEKPCAPTPSPRNLC